MTPKEAYRRDLAVACLVVLHEAAVNSRAAELADDLRTICEHGVDADVLTRVPTWLWRETSSGLQMILNAATEPEGDSSTAAEVAQALGEEVVADLLDLDAEQALPGRPVAPTVIVTTGDDRHVAISLWPPDARHPWFRPAEPPEETTMAIRRVLAPFESLADLPIDLDLEAGYLWPAHVAGRPTLGLHTALVALARATGLSNVPATLVAIGDLDEKGGFTVPPDTAASATDHLACAVLMRGSQGWQLTEADGTVRTAAGDDLDTAAALVWGDEWTAWKREQHRRELELLGWAVVDPSGPSPHHLVPETDVQQVNRLFTLFHQAIQAKINTVAVLGGPPSSGKSVIVRCLAARLAQQRKNPPLTRIIASTTHELPNREVALRIGRHALGMDEAIGARRRLLVLDDLHPVGDGNVDALLPYLSHALGCSILGVLQYDVNSNEEWQTDHINVVTAVVGRQAMRTFVEELCEAHPQRLDRAAGLAELNRPRPTADVRRLIQIMLGQNKLIDQFQALDEATRTVIATTAAWTLARGWYAHDLLGTLTAGQCAAFGLESDSNGTQWRLPSPDNCRAILTAYRAMRPETPAHRRMHPIDATMADLLLPGLLSALREGSPRTLTLLRGIRLHRNAVVAEVIRRSWDERILRRWIRHPETHPARIAELLVDLNVWLSEAVVKECLDTLIDRLGEQTDTFTVQDALVTIRCVRAYLAEITAWWRSVGDWIHDQVVDHLTRGNGSAGERFQLLRLTESFYDMTLQQVITEHAGNVLGGLDASQADDYYLVRRVRALQSRAERALRLDQTWFPIEQEAPVQALLAAEPPKNAGLHLIISWLALQQYFGEATWDNLLDEHEHRFVTAMRYTSPHEFSRAFNELKNHGATRANAVFHRAMKNNPRRKVQENQPFLQTVRALLHNAAPIEAAEMLRSIAAAHIHAAYILIYPRDDEPDNDFAARMADRAVELADAKGVGMLLSVTQSIDEIYVVQSGGFAQTLASHLGKDRVLGFLRDDPRPSVKYYLIKGISDAQVPFLRECLSAARDIVVDAITRGRKPWGPRLALRLGSNLETGQEFLLDLRDHLPLQAILEGMGPYSSPETQTEFHRLGRALFPEATERYATEFDIHAFLGPLAAAPPVPTIECCREVGRTLAEADHRDGGPAVVRAVDRMAGETNAWANRLTRTRRAEQMVQALNILLDIDRPTTRSALAELNRLDDDESESLLVWKARRAVFDSPTAAVALFKTLDDAEPGLGSLVYDHLREEPLLLQVLTYELQVLQSSSAQYAAIRHLAAIGVLPGRVDTEWMSQNFTAKLTLIAHRASPHVLTDIIRMFSIGKENWADRAVRLIDHAKLSARLRVGRSHDFAPAVRLAALLLDLGDRKGSDRIVGTLCDLGPGLVMQHLHLRESAILLELVTMLRPETITQLNQELRASIAARLSQPVVLDQREHWTEIGYACHFLQEAGGSPPDTRTPLVLPNVAHHAAVVWGLHSLPDSAWRSTALTEAADRLVSRPPAARTELFALLVVGARAEIDGPTIAGLSLRQIRVLHELGERNAALASLLAPAEEEIRRLLSTPVARISWDAHRLTESLARLGQQRDRVERPTG
ncbi:hypothetical protein [Micromonospora rifamycinica]|uniref:Uncharacterized protein n=1 Tax=Micromonospora rifamycinica TaxID=291594 RepID=A0A1C5IY53_9ACTN|nr:hypothetical protein [Micromonospora rifamycinica]SCG63287.1 hypothetical protein GA0070623_2978 [Micromonospora rifamycinica]